MGMDPRRSKNFYKSIKKSRKMNQGSTFPVGDKRLTAVEIAKLAKCMVREVNEALKNTAETPENFIARMLRRKKAT